MTTTTNTTPATDLDFDLDELQSLCDAVKRPCWYGTLQIADGITDEAAAAFIEAFSPDTVAELIAAARRAALARSAAPESDLGALGERSDAWMAVTDVLREVAPGWINAGETGMDAAVATIRKLAAPSGSTARGVEQSADRAAMPKPWEQRYEEAGLAESGEFYMQAEIADWRAIAASRRTAGDVPGAHHLTSENVAAVIKDLREIEDGTTERPIECRDWRTWAGVLARIMEWLAAPVSAGGAGQVTDLEARHQVAEALGLGRNEQYSYAWPYLIGIIKECAKACDESTESAPAPADLREQFEAWAHSKKLGVKREGDGYYWPATDDAWGIWTAAKREASTEPSFEQIAAILNGIDETETGSKCGWWETSLGAKFGAEILEKIRALFKTEASGSAQKDEAKDEAKDAARWRALIEDTEARPCQYPCLRDDLADWLAAHTKEGK